MEFTKEMARVLIDQGLIQYTNNLIHSPTFELVAELAARFGKVNVADGLIEMVYNNAEQTKFTSTNPEEAFSVILNARMQINKSDKTDKK